MKTPSAKKLAAAPTCPATREEAKKTPLDARIASLKAVSRDLLKRILAREQTGGGRPTDADRAVAARVRELLGDEASPKSATLDLTEMQRERTAVETAISELDRERSVIVGAQMEAYRLARHSEWRMAVLDTCRALGALRAANLKRAEWLAETGANPRTVVGGTFRLLGDGRQGPTTDADAFLEAARGAAIISPAEFAAWISGGAK